MLLKINILIETKCLETRIQSQQWTISCRSDQMAPGWHCRLSPRGSRPLTKMQLYLQSRSSAFAVQCEKFSWSNSNFLDTFVKRQKHGHPPQQWVIRYLDKLQQVLGDRKDGDAKGGEYQQGPGWLFKKRDSYIWKFDHHLYCHIASDSAIWL